MYLWICGYCRYYGYYRYCGYCGYCIDIVNSIDIADIIDIARQSQISNKPFIPSLGFMINQIKEKEILSIDDINSEFYLRLSMKNQAGSLAKITKIFASHNISIDAMTQKVEHNQSIDPDIFLVTSKTKESIVNEIIKEIEAFPDNNHKICLLYTSPSPRDH